MLGQQVDVLVNGVKNGGYHEVKWDAGSAASGIYFYIIKAQSFTESNQTQIVKKMILTK